MHTFTDKIVKTRKEHRCHGCMENFPVGQNMRYIVNTFDGRFDHFYLCHKCDKCMKDLDHIQDEGFQPGDIPYQFIKCQNGVCNNYREIKDLTLSKNYDGTIELYVCIDCVPF